MEHNLKYMPKKRTGRFDLVFTVYFDIDPWIDHLDDRPPDFAEYENESVQTYFCIFKYNYADQIGFTVSLFDTVDNISLCDAYINNSRVNNYPYIFSTMVSAALSTFSDFQVHITHPKLT